MSRKCMILAHVVLLCAYGWAQGNEPPDPCDAYWFGQGCGLWGVPSNWEPPLVPDNNPFRTFWTHITDGCVRLGEDRTVDSLSCSGNVTLEKFTPYLYVFLTADVTNHGRLKVEQIHIRGHVTNATGGKFRLNSARIFGDVHNEGALDLYFAAIEGSVYNAEEATFGVEYEVDVEDGDFENAGLIEIPRTGEIYVNGYFHNTGRIFVDGGECGADEETIENDSTGVIEGCGLVFAEQLLYNKGVIRALGGPLVLRSRGNISNAGMVTSGPFCPIHVIAPEDVHNHGTIEIDIGAGVVLDCNLVNEPDGRITMLDGTLSARKYSQKAGATLVGFGRIGANVLIESGAIIKLNGPTNIVGDVEILQGASLEVSDGTTLVTGHTSCDGRIHMKGGRIILQGGMSGDCSIVWEPGLYNNIADFNLDGKVNMADYAYFADTWLWESKL